MEKVRLIALACSGALLIAGAAACSSPSAQQSAQQSAQPAASAAAPALTHIRGTVTAVSASSLTIKTPTGNMTVMLPAKPGVVAVVPATRAAIKPGTFIGTANVPGSKTDRALEVVVFPNSMRGTGEGNYSWDLSPKSGGSSMMTNGTVASEGAASHSMMTNGTVSSAKGSGQLMLDVTYKGGVQHIVVPANVPIVQIVPGTPALLVPMAHVFVVAKGAAPHMTAARIIVGKDGAVPPM